MKCTHACAAENGPPLIILSKLQFKKKSIASSFVKYISVRIMSQIITEPGFVKRYTCVYDIQIIKRRSCNYPRRSNCIKVFQNYLVFNKNFVPGSYSMLTH